MTLLTDYSNKMAYHNNSKISPNSFCHTSQILKASIDYLRLGKWALNTETKSAQSQKVPHYIVLTSPTIPLSATVFPFKFSN